MLRVLVCILLTGCVDLNITFRVPCTASLVRDTSALSDTLAVWKADSLGCPR